MDSSFIVINTPLGPMRLSATEQGICEVEFVNDSPKMESQNELLQRARIQLDEYFAGTRKDFDLPLHPAGTDYQKQIWNELIKIPFGTTTTYGELAKKTNSVARAVGSANGSNPIAIIVPCHRVIGANGKMTGYAGGLERKIWLLKHESGMLV